jgi:hypothetical protein
MSIDSNDENREEIQEPFKISKTTISKLMSKYLSRKFAEDIDYLSKKGGHFSLTLGISWLERGLVTNFEQGLIDDENLNIIRVNVYDSNEPAPEDPISKTISNL